MNDIFKNGILRFIIFAFMTFGLFTECKASNKREQQKNENTKKGSILQSEAEYESDIRYYNPKDLIIKPGEKFTLEFDIKDYEELDGIIINDKGIRKKANSSQGVYVSKLIKVLFNQDGKMIDIPAPYMRVFVQYAWIGSQSVTTYIRKSSDGVNWLKNHENKEWWPLFDGFEKPGSDKYCRGIDVFGNNIRYVQYKMIIEDDSILNDFNILLEFPNNRILGSGKNILINDFTKNIEYESCIGIDVTSLGLKKKKDVSEGILISKIMDVVILDNGSVIKPYGKGITLYSGWIGGDNAIVTYRTSIDGMVWGAWKELRKDDEHPSYNADGTRKEKNAVVCYPAGMGIQTKFMQYKIVLKDDIVFEKINFELYSEGKLFKITK